VANTGPALDAARRLVVERNLVRAAFEHLTVDALMAVPFEALGPVKTLLKRFFSEQPWGSEDDEALAAAVGPGEGEWRRSLDPELTLVFGWDDGRFRVRVESEAPVADGASPSGSRRPPDDDPLAGTFDGPVVPEATPNPRTIRFQVGPIHDGPSRWYESAAAAVDEPPVARLFAEVDEVANVLVGPDFLAVGLRRAADWERLLHPVLALVTGEFAPDGAAGPDDDGLVPERRDDGSAPERREGRRVMGGPAGAGVVGAGEGSAGAPAVGGRRRVSRVEQAWQELGSLRPADAPDLARVVAAAESDEPARRQVAANLLREADAAVAARHWARLVADPVRSVRRSAVDAVVDVDRPELRALLESALADADAWVRWKALRGLAQLGAGPSRAAIEARADDPDFRIRLEAAAALRSAGD
jgi:Scaffold protein Nfu/NifU N terminal/HEAT repeats